MNGIIESLEKGLEWGGTRRDVTFLVISGAALLLSLIGWEPLPFEWAWVAIVLCGTPIVLEAVIGLVTRFDIKADVLVSLALVSSIIIGEYFAAAEVAFIMQIGALLEDLTVAKARAGIEKLVRLTPQTARLIAPDGSETTVRAEEVQVDARVRVLPGETIPVDGVIVSGQSSIDQAVITGESMPVEKGPGDEVLSGTVNRFGAFELRAAKVGEDSSIQRMIRLVQSADAGKAKIVRIADRWATWIVVTALTAAVLTWMATGEVLRAVTILVVFCPCALVLATPTAIMAAIGNATKHGFLVKEGDALERLATVDKVMCDKTGTLTYGKPHVTRAESVVPSVSSEELYRLCASVENLSEHPIGRAVVNSFKASFPGTALASGADFDMQPGRGVSARVEGHLVEAGSLAVFKERQEPIPERLLKLSEEAMNKGETVICVGMDGSPCGMVALSDTVREESASVVRKLGDLGVRTVLLTGDHRRAAEATGKMLGIEEIHADCRPEEKLDVIDENLRRLDCVCMIGDGVNDAPALKKSTVGIAMGGMGSDIAVDAADIVLVNDELKELPHLFALSKRTMTTIKLNMTFSMALNFVAIILAMAGILNPVVGALVHNAGSVIVILNSSFLLKWRKAGL